MDENYLNKKIFFSFIFFFFIFLLLVSTNYTFHFPNDGVKYVFDSQILIEKLDIFFSEKEQKKIYNSNFFSPQSGIVFIIFILRQFFGELWIFGYVILIALLNSILFWQLFKIKKIFNLNNLSFFLLNLMIFSNFEYLKVSKSYYNEALYIPLLYIFIINLIEYCFSDNKKFKINYLIFSFLILSFFFRLQHICLILSLLSIYFFGNINIKKYLKYLISFLTISLSVLFYFFYSDNQIFHSDFGRVKNILYELSLFLSFSNFNKFYDASFLKNYYQFYIFLLPIVFIYIYQISKYIFNPKFFIFTSSYIIFNFIFLSALVYNDERYFLTVSLLLSILIVDFLDKSILKKIFNENKLIQIFLGVFTSLFIVIICSYIVYDYKNSKTYNTIKIINEPITRLENNKLETIYVCETPRICVWQFLIKSQDTYKIIQFKNDLKFYKKNNYLYIGDLTKIKNLKYKIIYKKSNIVLAKLII